MHRQLRFKSGESVRIRPDDPSPFAGLQGIVEEGLPHERDIAVLDRYVVSFKWGERQSFYNAQLEEIDSTKPLEGEFQGR